MLRAASRVGAASLLLALLPSATFAADPLSPGSTLCLLPVEVPIAKSTGEGRRADVERRLRDALTAASFQVPDPEAVANVVDRVKHSTGGFVDAATGDRDEARYRTFQEQCAAALRNELGCDAELSASVVRLRAAFINGTATWDGTTDSVSSTGRQILNALGGVIERGWVAALSLWLSAHDLKGQDLAFRSAGIEVLVSLAVLRDQDTLPEDLWLTNPEKIDGAIQSALGPGGEALRHKGAPPGVISVLPTPGVEDFRHAIGRPERSGTP